MVDIKRQEEPEQTELSIDTVLVTEILCGFIKDCFSKTSSEKAIIGLSGGVDSSVVAVLASRALGSENVLGVTMPYTTSALDSQQDAELVARNLEIKTETVPITPMVDAYLKHVPDADENRRGNYMARQRMAILYDISARERGLVIGTSNKSELLLGYGTIFGDLACAINPIGDLYKTQIRQLADALEIPERIIKKPPKADLIQGQTDESDLGFTYEDVDKLLYCWVDKRFTEKDLQEKGFDPKFISNVITRVRRNHFKRITPLIAKISSRTIGHEFRYAWDWSNV